MARDIARWSQNHVREIAEIAHRYGEELDPQAPDEPATVVRMLEKGSELVGRRPVSDLLKLCDLRELAMKAFGVSTEWEMVAQAAQGIADADLLAVCQHCHPQTLRQMKWANAQIKQSSSQALLS